MADSSGELGLLDPLAQGTRAIELTSDAAWLQALLDAELALCRAEVKAGLVPEWMRAVCDSLSDASELDLASIASQARAGGNPVIPLVKQLGAAAENARAGASDHLHLGATSQDILDTAAMIIAGRVLGEVERQLAVLADRLAVLAEEHRGTVMAGRTLGQQAAPTTFGFVVAGWLEAVLTMLGRIDRLGSTLPVQFGGAVGTLSVLAELASLRGVGANAVDEVVDDFARQLGLARPAISWHGNRVLVTELASVLAATAGVVASFALEVTVLSRTEIAELAERLGNGEGGSSAMPHKRNPVTAVLVVAAARQAPGLLATVFGSLLSEDQRPSGSWHAEWQPLAQLERLAISAVSGAASLAGRLEVNAERMRRNLDLTDGLVSSERVTTILAEELGRAAAFALVERASLEAVATGRPLQIVLSGELATAGAGDGVRSRAWDAFDYSGDIGTSGACVDRVLERYRSAREGAR